MMSRNTPETAMPNPALRLPTAIRVSIAIVVAITLAGCNEKQAASPVQTASQAVANSAPTIAGVPAVSVVAGAAYSFLPSASDSNGDLLSFSISGKPVWATFSTSSGALTGTPSTAQVGTYSNIVITVSDGAASQSLASFSITVSATSSGANRSPTISGSPAITAAVASAYQFTPQASDPDGNALTFTIANKPSWAAFNTQTGALTGTPTIAGVYSGIAISVSDGALTAALSQFAITVSSGSTAASAVADNCATNVYNGGYAPVLGMNTAPMVSSSRPAKGAVFADPNYHTCVVRAADHTSDGLSQFARNDYSRRQAFNSDNTRYLVYDANGSWYMYDASTLSKISELTQLGGDAEPQWDATDPQKLYYVPTNGGTVLYQLNVVTNVQTVVGNFATGLPWSGVAHVWTKSEGSPSADSRYWCFMAENSGYNTLGIFTWDKQTNTVLGTYTTSNRPDHVSMAPSGNHCVVSWDAPTGTYSFSRTMQQERKLHTASEHSDLAIGADGSDYYVSIDYDAANGDVFMLNLDTGVRTDLFATYFGDGSTTAVHISGKAFRRPGWVVVSTYMHNNPLHWLHEKVFLVQMAANPKIVNFTHTHRVDATSVPYGAGDYWAEPHASANRDLTRIMFNSNWESGSSAVEDYMIVLPDTYTP